MRTESNPPSNRTESNPPFYLKSKYNIGGMICIRDATFLIFLELPTSFLQDLIQNKNVYLCH